MGDIEGLPFLEAVRQLSMEVGREKVLFVHITYVPLAGGGRYDGLYKNLGRDICAFGGAFYLDLLLEV